MLFVLHVSRSLQQHKRSKKNKKINKFFPKFSILWVIYSMYSETSPFSRTLNRVLWIGYSETAYSETSYSETATLKRLLWIGYSERGFTVIIGTRVGVFESGRRLSHFYRAGPTESFSGLIFIESGIESFSGQNSIEKY